MAKLLKNYCSSYTTFVTLIIVVLSVVCFAAFSFPQRTYADSGRIIRLRGGVRLRGGIRFGGSSPIVSSGGGGSSTWNPADKGSLITLSGGNLIATQNSAANTWNTVRSTSSYTVGTNHKVVFTLNDTAYDGSGGWIGGLANSAANLSSNIGSSGITFGSRLDQGIVNSGGVTTDNNCYLTTAAVGQTIYFAVDFNTGKVWCTADCTQWIGNPDTGLSDEAVLPASAAVFIAWSGNDSPSADSATLNVNPNLTSCTDVSTYSGWK